MITLLALGCAGVLLAVGLACADDRARTRDACLALAALAVVLLPVAHVALQFFGFVVNPRHHLGNYWTMRRDAETAAVVAAVVIAASIAAAGSVAAFGGPHSRWRHGAGLAEVLAGLVFAGVEVPARLAALADATGRIGTIPM